LWTRDGRVSPFVDVARVLGHTTNAMGWWGVHDVNPSLGIVVGLSFSLFIARFIYDRLMAAEDRINNNNQHNKWSSRDKQPFLSTPTSRVSQVTLLIDGCNGPMRLDRNLLWTKGHEINDSNTRRHVISLLQVVGDENRGDRIWLVPALQAFLERHQWQSTIYFDGVGVGGVAPTEATTTTTTCVQESLHGREWQLSNRIVLQVTHRYDEADNVIVQQVEQQRRNLERTRVQIPKEISLSDAYQLVRERRSRSSSSHADDDPVAFTFLRNANGCGKSRTLVKKYGLMRPESVFCLFVGVSDPPHVDRDLQCMSRIRNLLLSDCILKEFIGSNSSDHDDNYRDDMTTTIVVTDDIFLRQRVVYARGLVMTFEQLWELLVPYDTTT
jgi:hypothetical protein